jgi:DNA recombination-dependent growth factor C
MMGLISGSGSFTRYLADGVLPEQFMEVLSEKIARYAFRNLDEKSIEERSVGWVNVMDMFDNRFAGLEFLKEPYIAMSLRIDERKIPSTALKQYCLEAEEKIKKDENLEYLPKRRRSDIKEGVRLRLLKRAIPVTRCYDMIWNYSTGLVIFGCTTNRLCDEFVEFFLQTFDIQLQAICPYTLASRFLEKEGVLPDLLDGLGPSDLSEEK